MKSIKYTITAIFSALLFIALPLVAMAASPESGKQEMSQEGQAMQHGGMMMGGMIMLEVKTEDGVQGMVHLKDVSEAMAKMGMKENYHFMVMFNDNSTGDPIVEGTVALKITDPAGKESEPLALMPMDDMFGADIVLTEKGAYRFTVGTKLTDGKKRQFEFEYTLK
jgi:hypothetical protein